MHAVSGFFTHASTSLLEYKVFHLYSMMYGLRMIFAYGLSSWIAIARERGSRAMAAFGQHATQGVKMQLQFGARNRRRLVSAFAMFVMVALLGVVQAAPVSLSGATGEADRSNDRPADSDARGVGMRADAGERRGQTDTPTVGEGESEWSRFRKTLRGLIFDQADEATSIRQPPPVRAQPGFSTNITPGAFQVPANGAHSGNANAAADGQALEAVREMSRQAASAPGGLAAASPAAPETKSGATGSVGGGAQPAVVGSRDDRFGTPAGAESSAPAGQDMQVFKSRETKMLEGMLVSQLIDQIQPWAIGLVAVLAFWQLIKGMIFAMQSTQERALRRKAEQHARSVRKASRKQAGR